MDKRTHPILSGSTEGPISVLQPSLKAGSLLVMSGGGMVPCYDLPNAQDSSLL